MLYVPTFKTASSAVLATDSSPAANAATAAMAAASNIFFLISSCLPLIAVPQTQ
jgi:hypothetical protein